LHALRLGGIAIQKPLDVGAHALVDQGEEARRGRIQAVVEIEDPVAHMAELRSDLECHDVAAPSGYSCFSKLKGF